jgi:hypothetical protein
MSDNWSSLFFRNSSIDSFVLSMAKSSEISLLLCEDAFRNNSEAEISNLL